MPEVTLKAFAEHGTVGDLLSADGWECEEVSNCFQRAGFDVDALATQLSRDGAEESNKSWNGMIECDSSKSEAFQGAR